MKACPFRGLCAVLVTLPAALSTLPARAQPPGMTIQEAIQLALTRNERARISDLQVIVADAAVEKARAGFLPIMTLSGNDQQHIQNVSPASNNVGTASFTV